MPKKQPIQKEQRRFMRHSISLPLHIEKASSKGKLKYKTVNMSLGGLLFLSRKKIALQSDIFVYLPFKDKVFKVEGLVVRCEKEKNSTLYQVGISFKRVTDSFKAKLVEQLHLIEEYRCLRSIQLNREVTLREASEDWIQHFSKRFQELYW